MFSNHLDRAGAALLSGHTGHIVQPFISCLSDHAPTGEGRWTVQPANARLTVDSRRLRPTCGRAMAR